MRAVVVDDGVAARDEVEGAHHAAVPSTIVLPPDLHTLAEDAVLIGEVPSQRLLARGSLAEGEAARAVGLRRAAGGGG